MTELVLLNDRKYEIKENADSVDEIIRNSKVWVELTLVKNSLSKHPKEERARFMINSIAYWY